MTPHRLEDSHSLLFGPFEFSPCGRLLGDLAGRWHLGLPRARCPLVRPASVYFFSRVFSSPSYVMDLPFQALTAVCQRAAWGYA